MNGYVETVKTFYSKLNRTINLFLATLAYMRDSRSYASSYNVTLRSNGQINTLAYMRDSRSYARSYNVTLRSNGQINIDAHVKKLEFMKSCVLFSTNTHQ